MNERKKSLLSAVEIIVSLIRTVQLKQTLDAVSREPALNFWRVIYGNLADMAVLEWCKLFGSDDGQNQHVHWKNIASDPEKFRKELFQSLKIYESKWRSYWTEMKRYRDLSVAHHDARRVEIPNYPTFDLALEAAYFYYGFVVSELRKEGVDNKRWPKDLRAYSEDFAAECHDIATAAIHATASFKERVY